ncbi:MAG: LPXTG cell wall anchor domain-containing protein [Coriobacteriales bacterium]|jgi:uncharacterized repeat protein (TIGR01451 family)/LPXTG-motif cell wall-anchored protein
MKKVPNKNIRDIISKSKRRKKIAKICGVLCAFVLVGTLVGTAASGFTLTGGEEADEVGVVLSDDTSATTDDTSATTDDSATINMDNASDSATTSDETDSSTAVETQEEWEKTVADVELLNDPAHDVVAVAQSQYGTSEVESDTGTSANGVEGHWSRYGAFAGDPYGSQPQGFISFVLYYSQDEDVPAPDINESIDAWVSNVSEADSTLVAEGDGTMPTVGSFVVLDLDGDGSGDNIGVVELIAEPGTEAPTADEDAELNYVAQRDANESGSARMQVIVVTNGKVTRESFAADGGNILWTVSPVHVDESATTEDATTSDESTDTSTDATATEASSTDTTDTSAESGVSSTTSAAKSSVATYASTLSDTTATTNVHDSDKNMFALRKGVVETGTYFTDKASTTDGVTKVPVTSNDDQSGRESFLLPKDTTANSTEKTYVVFYVALVNDGSDNLYLSDIQDVCYSSDVMKVTGGTEFFGNVTTGGFEFLGGYVGENSNGHSSTIVTSVNDETYSDWGSTGNLPFTVIGSMDSYTAKNCGVHAYTGSDGHIYFKIDNTYSSAPGGDQKDHTGEDGALSHDTNGYYLQPGEYLGFSYVALSNNAEHSNLANVVAMPVSSDLNVIDAPEVSVISTDFNGENANDDDRDNIKVAGVGIGSAALTGSTLPYTVKVQDPNDSTENGYLDDLGLTTSSSNTYLVSGVGLNGPLTIPGVTKEATAKTHDGVTTQNPDYVAPGDTVEWTITATNDGQVPITSFTITDVTPLNYAFVGNLDYKSSDGKTYRILQFNTWTSTMSLPYDSPNKTTRQAIVKTGYDPSSDSFTGSKYILFDNAVTITGVNIENSEDTKEFEIVFNNRTSLREVCDYDTINKTYYGDYLSIDVTPSGETLDENLTDEDNKPQLIVHTKATDNLSTGTGTDGEHIQNHVVNYGAVTPLSVGMDTEGLVHGHSGSLVHRKSSKDYEYYAAIDEDKLTVYDSDPVVTSNKTISQDTASASSDSANNYMDIDPNKTFTYTLEADVSDVQGMSGFTFIDALPSYENDSSSATYDSYLFNGLLRNSDITVGFASNPNVRIKYQDSSGNWVTIDESDYGTDEFDVDIKYSTETDYDYWLTYYKWKADPDKNPAPDTEPDSSPTSTTVTATRDSDKYMYYYDITGGSRSIYVHVNNLPDNVSKVRVLFDAEVPTIYQETGIAWNSFGYTITTDDGDCYYGDSEVAGARVYNTWIARIGKIPQTVVTDLDTLEYGNVVRVGEVYDGTDGEHAETTDQRMIMLAGIYAYRHVDVFGEAVIGLYSPSSGEQMSQDEYDSYVANYGLDKTYAPMTIERDGTTYYLYKIDKTNHTNNGTTNQTVFPVAIFENLTQEKYLVKELKAPEGYSISRTKEKLITRETSSYYPGDPCSDAADDFFSDSAGEELPGELPGTGSFGIVPFIVGGLAIMGVAGFGLYKRKQGRDNG